MKAPANGVVSGRGNGSLTKAGATEAPAASGREFASNQRDERERRRLLAARLRTAVDGISCQKLSEITGWSAESFRRYLQGKFSPPATLLMVLAEELAINPEYLLFGRGPTRLDSSSTELKHMPSAQVLDALYFLISQQSEGPGEEQVEHRGRAG